jgi:hypothetical protein
MFKLFHKDHPVPKGLQLAFTVAVSAAFLVEVGYTLVLMFQQSFTNTNFSAFVGILASQTAVPALLFGIAYYLNPRKLRPAERVFESLIITVTGLAAFTAFMQLLVYVGAGAVFGGEHFMAYHLVTAAIVVLVYSVVLWQLRSSKRWK